MNLNLNKLLYKVGISYVVEISAIFKLLDCNLGEDCAR